MELPPERRNELRFPLYGYSLNENYGKRFICLYRRCFSRLRINCFSTFARFRNVDSFLLYATSYAINVLYYVNDYVLRYVYDFVLSMLRDIIELYNMAHCM